MLEKPSIAIETNPHVLTTFDQLLPPVIEAGWYFCIGEDDQNPHNWLRRRLGVFYFADTNEVYSPTEDQRHTWLFNL